MRMMTSVSMLERMIGAAIAASLVNGVAMLVFHHPHVGNCARYRRRHRCGRTCQMGAGARPLAADEIAIGGRDRALTGRYRFTVGGQTHRASRFAPFESGIGEKLV